MYCLAISNAFFSNLSDDEAGFWVQMDNQKAQELRFSVNIPIFSRFQNKTNVAKSKIQEENNKLNLEQAKLNLERFRFVSSVVLMNRKIFYFSLVIAKSNILRYNPSNNFNINEEVFL